ncbi:glycosyltransferase family 4 protein [Tenacibaculum ovolyticum]|uniref:glycosyltransferase family 4 protein n=1 Tax=Tenacibaculum ovolyticum TaxID=104270 RepID=UPI001F208817|nr:glycosyltransferase family 4 protein [Tenacibaculum ovolyticum]
MTRNKRILIFSDCYIYGGSEKLMTFLLKNKVLNEHYKFLFSYRKYHKYELGLQNDNVFDRNDNYPLFLLSNESLFHRINCLRIHFLIKTIFKLPFYILEKLKLYFIWNLITLIFFLIRSKPDLIHINNGGYPGAKTCNVLVFANYLTIKRKIIYQVNNQARIRKGFFVKLIDQFINKQVFYFINASIKAKNTLIKNRGFSEGKIRIVNNCAPMVKVQKTKNEICDELSISANSFILTQVGFLTERKGQKYLIDAIALLIKKQPKIKEKIVCLLVGNGEDEDLIKDKISELDLQKNVFLLGYKDNSEDYIDLADVFMLPSIRDEDMPLVLLSALGLGKPIIATDFAGITQVIESEANGILIENNLKNFIENLSREILNLYNNKDLRHSLSINAKNRYKKFSPENYGLSLKNVYEDAIR